MAYSFFIHVARWTPLSARPALAATPLFRVIPQIHAQGLSGDGKAAGIARPKCAGGNQHLLLASGALPNFHVPFLSSARVPHARPCLGNGSVPGHRLRDGLLFACHKAG
jgi:hypothetical protein